MTVVVNHGQLFLYYYYYIGFYHIPYRIERKYQYRIV